MKYPLLRPLLALGALVLACSCSDKSPSSGDSSVIPCEDALYMPSKGYLIYTKDNKVTDLSGNQIGKAVGVTTNIIVLKDMAGQNLLGDQQTLNINDHSIVTQLIGDPANCNVGKSGSQISTCEDARLLTADKNYLIYADGSVTDEAGNPIGTLSPILGTTLFNMVDLSGTPIMNNIDLNLYQQIIPGDGIRYKITEPAYHWKDEKGNYVIYNSTVVTDPSGKAVGVIDFSTGIIFNLERTAPLTVVDIAVLMQPKSILQLNSKCVDYDAPVVSSSSAYVPPVNSSSSTYVPPTPNSSSATPKSSSSKPKSSSSAPPPSSSSAVVTNKCPTIKTKSGGKTGSGWATRYWDCCKPHCSWPEHAHGNYSKQCTNKGQNESSDWSGGSVCSGGGLMTCTSQIPFTIDGCTEMGFAFAAVPASDGGDCGKCYQLTFTGKGKYSTDANHQAIKNKKLIIMTTNIGGDVQQGQFDIMIPGGGVGMFNGCSSMGWGNQGAQYGGLLSNCETEKNYKPAATLTCLKEKCNSVFSGDSKAKQGCLFLAEFMHGAGNPMHNYVEVECPEVLKSKY
ncbi:glycosyl hydrolase family 5 [Fibrobacter sp. UWB13]|uniref:glycosyl hydrolase family 5 n=1 Tax=Fibrobacter sp. UWB13 TaxID=1896204 RepID=UPI000A0D77F1|nr:glycosyl hydrolase family 5 [Fibrobacter sp. UWB13]SMG35302.1 Glycosyl hydrolase family 45 [Fibrobacter sp. UWB13]